MCITGNDTPKAHDTNTCVVPHCATRWRELGEALGMDPHRLDIITVDNPNSCEDRCKVMLQNWLKQDLSATWGKLVDAAETIHHTLPTNKGGE